MIICHGQQQSISRQENVRCNDDGYSDNGCFSIDNPPILHAIWEEERWKEIQTIPNQGHPGTRYETVLTHCEIKS